VRTGRWAARKIGASVVADLHENYPMALRFYTSGRHYSWIGRFRRSPRRWERYERKSVPSCAQVIAVVEEMRSRLIAVGVPADRTTVVANLVNVEPFLSFPVDPLGGEFDGRFVITYVGGFGVHRGLETAIRAMKIVVRSDPTALLLLVGDGTSSTDLEGLVRELSLDSNVRFEGRVSFDRVPSYIAASDICIIPHIRSVHTDAALPHKLFQYMLLGKPVVASSCDAVQRVVEDAKCGLLFPPGDDAAMADALLRLTDPELRERLGARGRAAVLDRYNWSESERRLLGLYGELSSPVSGSVRKA
jgi:glycosyltransferase involved in cell wall biosynthesis